MKSGTYVLVEVEPVDGGVSIFGYLTTLPSSLLVKNPKEIPAAEVSSEIVIGVRVTHKFLSKFGIGVVEAILPGLTATDYNDDGKATSDMLCPYKVKFPNHTWYSRKENLEILE